MGTWRVQMLGGFVVSGPEGTVRFRTQKTALVVAALARRTGSLIPRDQLAEMCWPDHPADAARQSLRMALSNIRQTLGAACLEQVGNDVGFRSDFVSCDLVEFLETGNLELLQGPLMPGFYEGWIVDEWNALQEPIARVTCQFLDQSLANGRFAEGVLTGKRILGLIGGREDIHLRLMRLYLAEGSPSLAIAQFEELESELDELYGELPSQEAIDLFDTIPRARRRSQAASHDLIGRDAILAELHARFHQPQCEQATLVTLLGTGGSGKTSIARALHQSWGDESVWIELSSETTEDGLGRRVLGALGLPQGAASEDHLKLERFLKSTSVILIFDNCEQLIPSGTKWLGKLLELGPHVRVLATSQREFALEGEYALPVQPLELPSPSEAMDTLSEFPAAALYLREATRNNQRFELTAGNAGAIAKLCRQLDGLPLALSLAGARTLTHSPMQILENLANPKYLRRGPHAEQTKHSSLDLTIRWSVDLLSADAAAVGRACSLILGSFTVDEAEALCPDHDVAFALDELATVSLLQSNVKHKVAEYHLYETIRSYLFEELRASSEFEDVLSRWVSYLAERVHGLCGDSGAQNMEAIRSLATEWANPARALEYAVPRKVNPTGCADLVIGMADVAGIYGYSEQLIPFAWEAWNWEKGVLSPSERARVGNSWVKLTGNIADVGQQLEVLTQCLAEIDPNDRLGRQAIHFRRCVIYKAAGDYDKAFEDIARVEELLAESDHWMRANVLYHKSLLECCVGNREQSLRLSTAAIPHARRSNEPQLIVRILFDAASEMANQKQGEAAIPLFEEALALCEEMGSYKLEGLTRWQFGDALLSMERPREALEQLQASVRLVVAVQFVAGLKWIFLKTGEALAALGHDELALQVLGKMVEVRNSENRKLADYEQADINRIFAALEAKLGKFQFDRYYFGGTGQSWEALAEKVVALKL